MVINSLHVAGETYGDRQEKLRLLRYVLNNQMPVAVSLRRELGNCYDAHAIAIDAAIEGQVQNVGYVPAGIAIWLSDVMDGGVQVVADNPRIIGGYEGAPTLGLLIRISYPGPGTIPAQITS